MSDRLRQQISPEGESLKTSDIVHWLRERQSVFGNTLERFAKKSNFFGFQSIEPASKFAKYLGNRPRIPEYFKAPALPSRGEFTGIGLCAIASGALEEALIRRYGSDVIVAPYLLHTDDMDVDTGKSIEEGFPPHAHTVLLFRAKNDTQWYLLDDTYRQFQIKIKPSKMLITPAQNIEKLYSIRQILAKAKTYAPEKAERYTPTPIKPRSLHREHIEAIKNKTKGFEKVTIEDYLDLIDSLE